MGSLDIDKITEAHRQLDRVLLTEWDPIGVSDCPTAQDEYRGYCRQIYDTAVGSRSAASVSEHLAFIERETMGLQGRSPEQLLPVARMILKVVADVGPLP